MHHKPFGGRALPGPAGGAYSARSPRPFSWIKGWSPGKGEKEREEGRDDVGEE